MDVATYTNPDALVLTGSTICASPGGTGTITSGTSVVGVTYQLYTSGNATVGLGQPGTAVGGGVLTWSSLAAGTGYYVIGTDNNHSCTSTSNAVDVATYPNPTITTGGGAAAVCYSAGDQATTLAYSATTNTPTSYSIHWDPTATSAGLADQGSTLFAFASGSGSLTGIVIKGLTAAGGPYSGTLTIANANGCTATQSLTVTVNALPTVAAITGTPSVYVGLTTQLADVTSGGVWSTSDGAKATVGASSGLVTGVAAGSATITYTVTSGGCSNSVSQLVTVTETTFLNVKIFLEGPYVGPAMGTTLNTGGRLPLAQPYNTAPWNYTGTESVGSIPNSNIVDWVLVELRDATTPALATSGTRIFGPKAYFLKSDGSIVDVDGSSMPILGNLSVTNNLYVIVRHRNHIAVMSSVGMSLSGHTYSYDFSTAVTQAYGGTTGYKLIGTSVYGMVTGDIDGDGKVFPTDYNIWAEGFGGVNGYFNADLDMDSKIFPTDYNKWAENFGTVTDPTLKSATLKAKYTSCVPE